MSSNPWNLQAPSSAVAVQAAEDAFYRQMKAAYDSAAAAAQVGLAKTAAEWDAAQATLRKAVLTAYSLVNDAQQSAPADVRQALGSTCNG
jgi:histidinol-phosphate/aromatic aminotransferase/cobyric acid decarboxylase-like protein